MATPGEYDKIWRRAMGLNPAPSSAYNPASVPKIISNNTAVSRNITPDYDLALIAVDPKVLGDFPKNLPNPYSDESRKLLDNLIEIGGSNATPPISTQPTPDEIPTTPAPTLQIQPQEQPQTQTSVEPPTTNQVVDNATLSATNPDIYALAKLASGDINNANRQLVYQRVLAKNDYDSAPTGKEGDAQRQAAANYAKQIEQLAQMRNIDLGQWGGNNLTTEQANLAWGNYVLNEAEKYQNKFQAVQDNLKNNYGESSNDHFWRLYDEYRQQGYGDRKAAILAGRETQTYQQDRVSNLRDAINEYGIDNGNILNQFGVNTLAQIAEEDNIMGTAIANGFETPKGNYEKQQAMILQAMKDAAADNRKQAEILAQKILTEYVQGQTNLRNAQTNQTRIDSANITQGGQDARQEKLFAHQWDLKKADQEFTYNLEQAKAEWAKQGKGDFTKSADYKIAIDNYERARQAYQDLLKDGAEPTTEELANAKAAYEKAQRDIEDVVKQYQFSQVPEEMLEVPKGDYFAALRYIQKLKSQGIYTDEMLIELATDSGYTGREARAMLEGKERPHSRTTG